MQRVPDWLLSELEDPFLVFPIQSVSRTISESIAAADNNLAEALSQSPASRKYWSVQAEHHFDEIGLLLGAAFVLGQALITQSISIVVQLQQTPSWPANLPRDKVEWMKRGSPIQMKCGLSEVEIIDTSANYFKHYCEWPQDWHDPKCVVPKYATHTIQNARAIGMLSDNKTDNLISSLTVLGASVSQVEAIASKIQAWRETIATQIRAHPSVA